MNDINTEAQQFQHVLDQIIDLAGSAGQVTFDEIWAILKAHDLVETDEREKIEIDPDDLDHLYQTDSITLTGSETLQ